MSTPYRTDGYAFPIPVLAVHPVVLYLVDLEIDNQLFPGVLVAGDEHADEVILGRNFLNLLPLFLDGPQQQTALVDGPLVQRLRMSR